MANKEGDFDPSTLILVDYDQAGYGFRAFDLIYNIFNWEFDSTAQDELEFITGEFLGDFFLSVVLNKKW